jgi:hypothetical protein
LLVINSSGELADLDPYTGAQLWVRTPGSTPSAVGHDGTLYLIENVDGGNALTALDGSTGAVVARYRAPNNLATFSPPCASSPNVTSFDYGRALFSPPIVGPDGDAYAVVLKKTMVAACDQNSMYSLSSFEYTLSLIRMAADGATTLIPIQVFTSLLPGRDLAYSLSYGAGETFGAAGSPSITIYPVARSSRPVPARSRWR